VRGRRPRRSWQTSRTARMPDPIEFRILQSLQTALRSISTGGGYHYTVTSASVKLDPNAGIEAALRPSGPRPLILIEYAPDRWAWKEKPNRVDLTMSVTIHWIADSDATDDDSRVKTFLKGCADVEKAITVDPGRGGLAVWTEIKRRTHDEVPD